MTVSISLPLRGLRAAAATVCVCGFLAACAQPGAEGPRPAWIADLDKRFSRAIAPDAAPAAAEQTAPQDPRSVLSFDVASDVDAATFSGRLAEVAERCWVADDASYRATLEAPTIVTLTFDDPKNDDAEGVEALRLVARARPSGEHGLKVDAVGPLAAESHRRVIERGLRQASADLSACL